MLLFVGDAPEVAEKFAKPDPYMTSRAVKRWHVREWKTVAGEDAAMPSKPNAVAAGKTLLYRIEYSALCETLWNGFSQILVSRQGVRQ